VGSDRYAVSRGEKAAVSRRVDALVSGATDPPAPTPLPAARLDALEARLAHIDETLAGLGTGLEALSSGLASAGESADGALGAQMSALRGDLADAIEELRGQVESCVSEAGGAVEAALEADRTKSAADLAATRAELSELVGYLAERDRWLEHERDRVLHEVLAEFAQGLSGRRRRALSGRLHEIVERRRDARDAQRYRRLEAGQAADGSADDTADDSADDRAHDGADERADKGAEPPSAPVLGASIDLRDPAPEPLAAPSDQAPRALSDEALRAGVSVRKVPAAASRGGLPGA
jgi:hypothetical protein